MADGRVPDEDGGATTLVPLRLGRLAGRDRAVVGDALLGGRLVGLFALHEAAQFLALAGAEVGTGMEARALLRVRGNHLEAQGLGELAEFVERGLEVGVAERGQLHRDDDGALREGFRFVGHAR